MDEIGEAEQRRYEQLLRKHRKALMGYANVHDVDVGYEFSNGASTGRLALRVYVTQKHPDGDLAPADRVPEEIDGIPVDVIQFNPTLHVARTANHNPVIGGVQIMNTSRTGAGTLGMIVMKRGSLQLMGLSNYHVMCRTPLVRTDVISQPGSPAAVDLLGPVVASDKTLDCAICALGTRPSSFDIYGVGAPTGSMRPRIGMKVVKSGLTTGVTWGRVDGVGSGSFSVVPDTSVPAGGEMSLPGDSGSIWMELATNVAVGLHYAGEGPTDPVERAMAKPIDAVLDKLEAFVFTGVAIGDAFIGGAGHVLAKTRPGVACSLAVTYPSGRRSTAKGLGSQMAGVRRMGGVALADRYAHQARGCRHRPTEGHPDAGDRRDRWSRAPAGAHARRHDQHVLSASAGTGESAEVGPAARRGPTPAGDAPVAAVRDRSHWRRQPVCSGPAEASGWCRPPAAGGPSSSRWRPRRRASATAASMRPLKRRVLSPSTGVRGAPNTTRDRARACGRFMPLPKIEPVPSMNTGTTGAPVRPDR